MTDIQLRPYQVECKKAIKANYDNDIREQLIVMATGCHAINTEILMYDGSVKLVQNISISETLMGDDSTPRKVLSLCRGNEMMVRIIPVKGDPFIVNESHILSLKKTSTPGKYPGMPKIVNISVKDYIHKNKNFKHLYKLYRTGVSFNNKYRLPKLIDPYWLGLWIGDGNFDSPKITNEDKEVIEYLLSIKLKDGYKMHTYHKGNGLISCGITSIDKRRKLFSDNEYNRFLDEFRCNNGIKHIPDKYCTLPYNDRLNLLAGILDSDGSLSCNGYDFVNKSFHVARSVSFMARSLGLSANIKKCKKGIKGSGFFGDYYRINIYGNTSIIPCKIKRKKASVRKQKKDVLVTGFSVEFIGASDYYGFELDGNHLYCMGDFTVTHNTGKRLCAVELMQHFTRSLFIAHREELIGQAYDEIEKLWPMQVGIIKGPLFEIDKKIVVASVQTLQNRLDRINPEMFQYVVVDECFPAGTQVDGKNIEDYKVGDIVSSFNHKTGIVEKKSILRVFKKKKPSKLYEFGYFSCTANHPIFIVDIGYCLAKEIHYAYLCYIVMRYGYKTKLFQNLRKLWNSIRCEDKKIDMFRSMSEGEKDACIQDYAINEMQSLRKRVYMGAVWNQPGIVQKFSKKRFRMLLSKMQERILFENSVSSIIKNESAICVEKDERTKSYVQQSFSRENASIIEGTDFSIERRKRSNDKTANYIVGIDPIGDGISNSSSESNVIGKISSKLLQSRSRLPGSKIGDRDRRENAQTQALEILRQKEDGSIEIIGLDNIKIFKSRSRRESTESSKENYVYNLEVEEHNNYFANNILVHNCHNYLSPSFLRTIRHFKPKLRTAWTATPKRLDGLSLTNIAQEMVFRYGIEDGITDGWLSGIEAYQIKTNTNISDVRRVAGDFNQGQLSERVDSRTRNEMIADKYLHYAKGRQGIAYCVDVKHSYNLRDILREKGVIAETIVGDPQLCPNRKEIINAFKKGQIEVLTNCEVLTEGFDYSDIGCILMGRPTQSERLYIQAIGRGTRIKSQEYIDKFGSSTCIVLDFVDNSGRLSLINAYELEKDKPIENRMFLPPEAKQKLLAAREERERKIKIQEGRDKKINLFVLPEIRIWNSEKMLEAATEKQINWMKQMGVWQEDVEYTKAMASELISAQPAKEWQIRWLAEQNYDVSTGCSLGQYQRVKNAFEMRNKYVMDEKEKNKILNKLKDE